MTTSKGIKSVVVCFLLLGLVLEQVQIEGKCCCKSTMARTCYNVCRLDGGTRQACADPCGCKLLAVSTCPSGYPNLHLPAESDEADATEYCTIGCMTSVCDNMNNVIRDQEVKIDMQLCNNACVRLCNKGVIIPSTEA
uniref:Uncharacterized protein n=1 Tax=Avena sativa TaxID=4498 RepID=A0ACD5Y2Y7_AVESA